MELTQLSPDGSVVITPFEELDQALERQPDAAIVATAAITHEHLTRRLLEQGVPTLVEKPLVLDSATASNLVNLAEEKEILFCVGLHLFFATYLTHFRLLWQHRPVATVHLAWLDCEMEDRHGQVKRANFGMPLFHDVFPHLWTILQVLFPNCAVAVEDVDVHAGGNVCVRMMADGLSITASITRRSRSRSRGVVLGFQDGGMAAIDFGIEPGRITLDERPAPSDSAWGNTLTPLASEVAHFLAAVANPSLASQLPCLARKVLDTVSGAELATVKLGLAAARKLAGLMASSTCPVEDSEIAILLVDNLAPELELASIRLAYPADNRLLISAALTQLAGDASMDPLVSSRVREALIESEFLRRVRFAADAGIQL